MGIFRLTLCQATYEHGWIFACVCGCESFYLFIFISLFILQGGLLLCTCIAEVVDKSHMRPLRHKGGNICIEGPLCPSLMEIQSHSLSPCSLVMPAAKPQMDHYVPAEWEGQETCDRKLEWGLGNINSTWF